MNKRKENYQNSVAEYKKSAVTNLMALVSFYAIDLIAIMLLVNQEHTSLTDTSLSTMITYWAIATYLILFALTFFTYRSIKNDKVDQTRLLLLCMLIITIFNLATFFLAKYFYSLILIVPILMLIYIREKAKRISTVRI